MKFNFEKIGKETVVAELLVMIKDKADSVQSVDCNIKTKIIVLTELAEMSSAAHDILVDLRDNYK